MPADDGGPGGQTRQLAEFVSAIRLEDVPHEVIERSKHLMLDGFACALSGVALPWTSRARAAVLDLEPRGSATVWGTSSTTSAASAALLNATATQAWEMDDYHVRGPLHVEAVVVTSALATAEHLQVDAGADLLIGIIAGQETGPRAGMALGGMALINRGWHNGAIYGTVASGVASGRIRRQSADQLENTLGTAATQACGLMSSQYEAMVTYMHHGFAARAGVLAAALSDVEFTGIPRVFEREYGGFISTFGTPGTTDANALTAELGSRWEIRDVAVKPYACMAGVHLPIELAGSILDETKKSIADIERIEVLVPAWLHRKGAHPINRPTPIVAAQMSIAYGVAVALLDGQALPPQFTDDRANEDDVWELIPRILVQHDEAIDTNDSERNFECAVRIRFTDSTVADRRGTYPLGSHARPLSNAEIVDKWREVVSPVLKPSRVKKLESTVLSIEDRNVTQLVELLGPDVVGHP